jgi:hypothetical protein
VRSAENLREIIIYYQSRRGFLSGKICVNWLAESLDSANVGAEIHRLRHRYFGLVCEYHRGQD